ncbi:MAG: DUF4864 domain-containing protein [Pseudomonadota bacterium]
MLRALILGLTFVFAGFSASAQEQLPPNPAIETTIQNQFDAFVARDIDRAFSFASPNIRRLFQNSENFGRMVQSGYPMVWDPGEVDFIDLQTLGGVIVQLVEVIDQAGTAHYLGYAMIETEAGWQINGVQVLRAPDVGA